MKTRSLVGLLVLLVVPLAGCTTVRADRWALPAAGEPSIDLKSAETRWLLIKNPRFGDVRERAGVRLGRGGQGPDDA